MQLKLLEGGGSPKERLDAERNRVAQRSSGGGGFGTIPSSDAGELGSLVVRNAAQFEGQGGVLDRTPPLP